MSEIRNIPFSPPDITQREIDYVIETLKSGWITTGPKTKLFENKLTAFCGTEKTVCLNSATAALELTLRLLQIGPGDEVITSAYTYTASASVIEHVGAKIILIDTQKDSFEMDYIKLKQVINEKTKAIIPVDIGGVMCDYDAIYSVVNSKKHLFKPANNLQKQIGHIVVIEDAAHSLGAKYNDRMCGTICDFTCFSFHAVKNLTTGEGGAVTWKSIPNISNDDIYNHFQLLSLHGQNKDALSKTELGKWEYDIVYTGYKNNMTDIMASIGLAQLERYEEIINKRKQIISIYNRYFKDLNVRFLDHSQSSGHLYLLRVDGYDEQMRNRFILNMAKKGITCNVHYKPLPMMTAYKNLGFDIRNYPNSYDYYRNVVSLPLYSTLGIDSEYVAETVVGLLRSNHV